MPAHSRRKRRTSGGKERGATPCAPAAGRAEHSPASEPRLPDLHGDFLDTDELTEKQRRFVVEYIATRGNATEAARRAYPDQTYESAAMQGHENMRKPHIKAAVARLLAPALAKARVTRDVVVREIGDGLAFDPIELTNPDGSMRTLREMPPGARRFLKRYKQSDIKLAPDGPVVGVATDVEFSREFYVQLAARMNKMLVDKFEVEDATGRAERLKRARERANADE